MTVTVTIIRSCSSDSPWVGGQTEARRLLELSHLPYWTMGWQPRQDVTHINWQDSGQRGRTCDQTLPEARWQHL